MEDKEKTETAQEKLERLKTKLESLGRNRNLAFLLGSALGVGAETSGYLALTHQSATLLKPWAESLSIGMAAGACLLTLMMAKSYNDEILTKDIEHTKLTLGPGLYSKKREEVKLDIQRVNKYKNIGIGLSVAGISAVIVGMINGASANNPIEKMILATIAFFVGNAVLLSGLSVMMINSSEEKVLRRRQRYLN